MKPPADLQLDLTGASRDLPLPPPALAGRGWASALLAATLVGVAASVLAWPSSLVTVYWALVAAGYTVFYYRYYRESREHALLTAQLETRLADARLKALQQQLQPHFLFNTLNSISVLMHRDVHAAERTLVRLSDLLRLILERLGEQEVRLDDEVDFIRKYLEIERTRFNDRLVVRYDVTVEAGAAMVPTLLLQPLVENAIKHGIARKSGTGHIDIVARREHNKLHIEVRDDGIGLSEDALTALNKGIGVSTTRARLQHQFGADYRFEFHRLPQGVAVVVAVPWRADPGGARPENTQASVRPPRVREIRAAS